MNKVKKRAGFTLIEILISITILLTLTVLGAIKYVGVLEENNIKLDHINAKTVADGVHMAILSGVIDDKSSIDSNSEQLSNFIDTSITTKSKKYSKGSSFSCKVTEGVITVTVSDKILYPYPEQTN